MSTAYIALFVSTSVFVALCSIRCGGFWRFAKRALATVSAWLFALSGFCGLMDHASTAFWRMTGEAVRETWKQAGENRRDALAEMGEKA